MHLKQLTISADLVEKFLTVGNMASSMRTTAGLPSGARLVNVSAQLDQYVIALTFEHESFPECLPGEIPERLIVTLAAEHKAFPEAR